MDKTRRNFIVSVGPYKPYDILLGEKPPQTRGEHANSILKQFRPRYLEIKPKTFLQDLDMILIYANDGHLHMDML